MRYADVFCSKQLFGGAARFQSGVSGDALALRSAAKAPCLMSGAGVKKGGGVVSEDVRQRHLTLQQMQRLLLLQDEWMN